MGRRSCQEVVASGYVMNSDAEVRNRGRMEEKKREKKVERKKKKIKGRKEKR